MIFYLIIKALLEQSVINAKIISQRFGVSMTPDCQNKTK